MPIFWRYLLGHYTKVLIFCTLSFIALLLVSRLEEISEIASFGASFKIVALFALYQICTILPIAIPISSLISAYILFQRLSQSYELVAFRSLGFSLKAIFYPLLFAASLFSLLNFYISSEISTACHLQTRKMAHELTSINPLLLLQNAKIAKLEKAYVQLDPVKQGSQAKNVVIAIHNNNTDRLNLLMAKKLRLKDEELKAEEVTLISSQPSTTASHFDHLMIENQKEAKSKATEFANLLRKGGLKIANDHLRFGLLRAKLIQLKETERSFFEKNVQKCYSEIMRRFSLGIAPFTFTLLGAAFGIQIGRNRLIRGILTVILLTALALIAFFVGKGFDHYFFAATLLFLLPHALIVYLSKGTLRRVSQGVE